MQLTPAFNDIVNQLSDVNFHKYEKKLLANATMNLPHCHQSLRDLPATQNEAKQASAIIISAGPSLRRKRTIERIKSANYQGTIIAVDAAYVACLRENLIPDYVVTLDPHPTRMVRWFGDHELAENTKQDDYFKRQDLDVAFRKNAEITNQQNIELVNQYGHLTKGIVSSSVPCNVLKRLLEAKMSLYWWNPLIDDPQSENSLTKRLRAINHLPALNTGGNVGTAAWVFAASTLKIAKIALVGMDLGYYADTPFEMTQTYPQLVTYNGSKEALEKYFVEFIFPLTQERFYTDVTYYWYRQNFLALFSQTKNQTINCTEGGVLFHEQLPCLPLEDFLNG